MIILIIICILLVIFVAVLIRREDALVKALDKSESQKAIAETKRDQYKKLYDKTLKSYYIVVGKLKKLEVKHGKKKR